MVDTEEPASLAQFQDSIGVVTNGKMNPGEKQTNQSTPLDRIERVPETVGWISRQQSSRLRSWEKFFLDIPFYRTHRRESKSPLLAIIRP